MSDPFDGVSDAEIRRLLRRKYIQTWATLVVTFATTLVVAHLLGWF